MAKQNKIITRIGKGTKLTSSEMDGNLEHLERLGTGENIGVIEPSNIDLSEIKNEFINKGDVSISLGDTEINHVVAGFVSDGLTNIIVTSDASDIQVGDSITISGDADETFNYNIVSVNLGVDGILLSESANIGAGDIVTISGDTDETFSFDVNSIGSDSFNVPSSVNLNIGDTFTISGDLSGTDKTEIGNVELSNGDFRIDNLKLGLVLNEGDVVTISGAKLGNTYDFTIQNAITESIENGYRVYFSLSEETQNWNWLYADGLSITVTGTNGFDGTYTLNSDSSKTGFGNLNFYVDFPLTQIERTHVSYLYNTVEANVNAPGGFLQYQGTIDPTTQTVVNVARINLPDPGRLVPSYQVGDTIIVSGTEEEGLSGDNGLLLTETYVNLPKKSYTFRIEQLSNSGWNIGSMGFGIQYPSGQPVVFGVNDGNGITTDGISWSTGSGEKGENVYFGTFTLTALGQGNVDLLNNISLEVGEEWTANLLVRKNSISPWNGAPLKSRQDLGFYNDLGLTDFTNYYYISLFGIIDQPYNLTGLQLNVTDSWGGSGEMDGSYEVVGRSLTYGHVIKAPKNFVLDETNGTPGLGSFNWSITVPSSDGTYEILSLNDKQDNHWLLVDGVIRHYNYGSLYLFPENYEWQSHLGRVSYTFQDYVYPNFNDIEIIDDNGWFKWSSATSTVGGASMTVPTANGDYTIKTCDSGYITFNEVFRDNFSDNLSTLIEYPVNSNDGTYTVSNLEILKGEITHKTIIVSEPLVSKLDVTGVTISYTLASNNGTYTVTDVFTNEDGSFTVFVEGALKSKEGNGEILSYTLGSNNGTYTVSQVLSDTEFINYSGTYTGIYVEEPIVDKVSDGNELATWIKSTRVEFSWIHAVLECGIVIWEAYDNDSNENNNGYWIAMKQDGQGEWIPVDAVKMTESFWNNWYGYTVKVPSNPRSVKLVGYDWTNGGSNPWNYSDYKPKFYHCELTMNESLTELTVKESFVSASDSTYLVAIASELGVSSEVVSIGQIQTPWWDSNDDWYGMMWGERMGWIWFDLSVNGSKNIVGFNMLSGEIQSYNSSELNPFGQSYEMASNMMSHPKFGLLITLSSGDSLYLYSPNFTEQKATKVTHKIEYGVDVNHPSSGFGGLSSNNGYRNYTYDFTEKYMYNVMFNGYLHQRGWDVLRIDIESGEVEYAVVKTQDFKLDPMIPYSIWQTTADYGLYGGINTWAKRGTWISYFQRNGDWWHTSVKECLVWRDEDKKPKLVNLHGYPTNFTSNTMFNADFVWKLPAIVSSTSTYKNNTF